MKRHAVDGLSARPKGVALIFALLLLVVLTVLAVGTFSSVGMQERMASNANLQALAFEGASAAITESLEWGFDTANWPEEANGTCVRGESDWVGAWSPPEGQPGKVLEVADAAGFEVQYRKRIGCFTDPGWVIYNDQDWEDKTDMPQQLLVLGRGEVVRTSDQAVIATREIEVRLEERGLDNPTCLIQTGPLSAADLRMPTSNAFEIDARPDGCAIQTAEEEGAEQMREQLGDQRIANYQPINPGITSGPLEGAWGDPELLARAANALKAGVRGYELEIQDDSGNYRFEACKGRISLPPDDSDCGGTSADMITYVAGDLEVSGNCTLHGPIITEGGFYSNGTPAYTGELLVLGGEIDVRGFGQADNSGLVILQNLENLENSGSANTNEMFYKPDSDPDPEKSKFIVRGGGNATITHDCVKMKENWDRLNRCLKAVADVVDEINANQWSAHDEWSAPDLGTDPKAVRFPEPRCTTDGSGRRLAIASWREFIDRGRWGGEN